MPEERKLVTILFADVTGSTALGESLDPEDVRALMGRYYEHARDVVTAYGGTIEKFIGDAVMAVFGLPQAHGDDAERALAAALALREVVARDEVLGESFQLRFGVNTGEVVATSDPSRGDFLITGDAVNVAARLQQNASPGEIVANERTADAAQTAFVFEEPHLIEVKGKRLPLRVFPLKGPRTTRQVNRPPLVGRKSDLMQLALLKECVLEEERPQLVSIVAPAGTGKTRLLEEFLKRLDSDEDFRVAMVRCLPYGQTLTYWPLQALLEGLMQSEKITKPPIMRVFTDSNYNANDAARLADLILATLGMESNNSAQTSMDREAIFNAWRLLIEAFAQQALRVLVFEDLHWASESMLDLVEHIINVRTHARLLLIVLSCPELLDRRPTWGGGRQNFTSIALQPLTTKQTQDLINLLAKTLPERVRQQIVERSSGNPFFALELLRGLVERGTTDEQASLDALPDTVHAAVLARLDMLSKVERTLLQVASVASRSFRASMLQAIMTDNTPQEIAAALDDLLQRDMLASTDGNGYTFRHILIRDVAYGTLSRAERMRLHSSIAAWLEANAPHDSYATVIAYHYREAVQLAKQSAVPKKLPHETERAVYYLTRAGELAGRAGAVVEARTYFQQALELAPASQHMHLYELIGGSGARSDFAVTAYSKAIDCWRNEGAHEAAIGARLLRKLLIVYSRGIVSDVPTRERIDALRAEAKQLAYLSGNRSEQWRIRIADSFCTMRYVPMEEISQEEWNTMFATGLEAATYFEQQENWSAFSESLDSCASISLRLDRFEDVIQLINTSIDYMDMAFLWMMFLSEHGMVSPDVVLDAIARQEKLRAFFSPTREVALALKSEDSERLSKAIDATEVAQLIVHAARMRIVLAQRTGDRSQLERAREVLERIQDRRFLRRLEEVAGLLK